MSDLEVAELQQHVEKRPRPANGSPVWLITCSAPGCMTAALSELSPQRAARIAWTFDWQVQGGKPWCWEHASEGEADVHRGD